MAPLSGFAPSRTTFFTRLQRSRPILIMSSIPGYPAKKSDWFWCVLGCVWGAGLMVHVAPFLHWSHARIPAALIHWLVYLPLSAVAVLAFRALLQIAPEAPHESKNVDYISRLDHLRFLAAILVVMFHFYHGMIPMEAYSGNPLLTLFSEGSSGVDLFFVAVMCSSTSPAIATS